MQKKSLTTPVKVILALLFTALVLALVYNQFTLSKQVEALAEEVAGLQTAIITPLPTASPTISPSVSPSEPATPTAEVKRVTPRVTSTN